MEKKRFSEEYLQELTTKRDELLSELIYLDHLMRLIGFTNGLATIKETAAGMCKNKSTHEYDHLLYDEDEEV